MLVAVIVGIVTGSLARGLHPTAREIELLGKLHPQVVSDQTWIHSVSTLFQHWPHSACCIKFVSGLIGLLGELMIRSLKMLVLPLVAGCMVASVCALGEAGSGMGRTAAWTLGIFFLNTCIAASLGVVLAIVVQPGHNGDLSSSGQSTLQRAPQH